MDITEQVRQILVQNFENEPFEEDFQSVMDRMLTLGKWEEVREGLLNILYGDDQTIWSEVVRFIYYVQNNFYPYQAAKTIAILYDCLTLSEALDENLVWTITKDIKAVSYFSDCDPYKDAEVLKEMNKVQQIRSRK